MQGTIIRGIAGFYYVRTSAGEEYECHAKGIFRKEGIKPLVGDKVAFQVLSETDKEGSIEEILPRKNELVRPAAANVDQVLLLFALKNPDVNLGLLDRFLAKLALQKLPAVLAFNKADLASEKECEELRAVYAGCGCDIFFISANTGDGLSQLTACLTNKITALAGPSGAGKSTLVNALSPDALQETGEISRKTKRGRHTTRHAEIFPMAAGGALMDTPGFTALETEELSPEQLSDCYPEFQHLDPPCRFRGCVHMQEPDCAVKAAVEQGRIHPKRYEGYRNLYQELAAVKRY